MTTRVPLNRDIADTVLTPLLTAPPCGVGSRRAERGLNGMSGRRPRRVFSCQGILNIRGVAPRCG